MPSSIQPYRQDDRGLDGDRERDRDRAPGRDRRLPARLEPLMALHLLFTRDSSQRRLWRQRIETILRAEAILRAPDPTSKAILSNPAAWDRMRATGRLGVGLGLGLGVGWMAWLIPTYAIEFGFGLWALTYLLPVPLATRMARVLWERASLASMRELGKKPSIRDRLRALLRGATRSFSAGFGFGFTLTFLQGLISAFMTPLPSLMAEIAWDAAFATFAGVVSGAISVALAPIVVRTAPQLRAPALPANLGDEP